MDQFVRVEKHRQGSNSAFPKSVKEGDAPSGKPELRIAESKKRTSLNSKDAKDATSTFDETCNEQIEDCLRLFDLNPRYGPFVGIDRMTRWNRAQKLGLNPPLNIKHMLEMDSTIKQRDGGHLW